MDTLGALVFGIVIVNAIRSRGVESPKLITRYAIIAGLIAGVGLALVYVSLFRLGAGSHDIAAGATNGAAVLHAYVQHTFGSLGSGFLAVLISLACLVTAVGLTCACAEYFSRSCRCPTVRWW
jgi:LIVCS family branched-chain amino acid:cation transporter